MANGILDRGSRGLHVPRPLKVVSGGWFEPQGGIYSFEDFIADHLAEDSTVTLNQSGTPITAGAINAAAGAPTAGHGGWIAGATDDVDAEIDELALGAKPWLVPEAVGDGMIVAEIGFVIPTALTARQYGFYLTDDETEGTATNGSLNIQTGTTVVDVATDAAGFIFSSLATDADGWYTANTKNGTQAVGTSVLTGVVDDYTKLRIEIDASGNAAFFGIVSGAGGREVAVSFLEGKAAAVTASVALVPLFIAAPTTTTSVEWEVDYIFGGASA